MYCVKTRSIIEESIKKSRFIGVIIPCEDEQAVSMNLKQLYQDYADASHIVYAYRIKTENGLVYRFNDAGEPTGTAGKPIYQHLEGKDLVNVLIAVIRYFGGVKLGAGGLTRAYGNAARLVIEAADIDVYTEWVKARLTLAYSQVQGLEYALKKLDGHIVEKAFCEQVHVLVQLPVDQLKTLLDIMPGHG